MLAEIGLIVGGYVIFRAIEAILRADELRGARRWGITALAAVLLLGAGLLTYDIGRRGSGSLDANAMASPGPKQNSAVGREA